ncbi:MAG: bifunctional nuclease domain-containing protein [Flavobacteriales bacterium]|jgi:bifunctional DNase/RNase
MSKKIELHIADIAPSGSTSGAYAMVLAEKDGNRRLPIVIGGAEAQAIAIELENMTPSRPLTHDLFRNLAHSFAIDIEEVLIYNLVEGIFFAKLIATMGGKTAEIDARTSDAVAIAVRFNCPIYCMEFILEQAGVNAEEPSDAISYDEPDIPESEEQESEFTSNVSIDELQRQLDTALEREEYEKASRIRDEINKRTGK